MAFWRIWASHSSAGFSTTSFEPCCMMSAKGMTLGIGRPAFSLASASTPYSRCSNRTKGGLSFAMLGNMRGVLHWFCCELLQLRQDVFRQIRFPDETAIAAESIPILEPMGTQERCRARNRVLHYHVEDEIAAVHERAERHRAVQD